jgi:hypothetical protein
MDIEGNKKMTTDTRYFPAKAAVVVRGNVVGRAHEVYDWSLTLAESFPLKNSQQLT